MSEKVYEFLLKLYPVHFRRTYGDEALRLVRDRALSEKGFLAGLRLWLDLLLDLAISLPREYSRASATPIVTTHSLNGTPSFQLLAERPLNPTLVCLAGTLSAVLFWVCISAVAHSRTFPMLFPAPLSLQGFVQSTLAQIRYHNELPAGDSSGQGGPVAHSFCITAQRDIPSNSVQPLFAFEFARPGASGAALIDGKVVKRFNNEQRLSIRAHVFAGDHQLVLNLDRPAESTLVSRNDDFEDCRPR